MKFRIQFDFHKIPEWYQEYFDYLGFKHQANDFTERVKNEECQKLNGLYAITHAGRVKYIDLSKQFRQKYRRQNSSSSKLLEEDDLKKDLSHKVRSNKANKHLNKLIEDSKNNKRFTFNNDNKPESDVLLEFKEENSDDFEESLVERDEAEIDLIVQEI